MKNWYKTFDEGLWLHPDEVGADEAAFIRKALGLRKGQRVLDAPCGAGRIAIHLAHTGLEVTGVDLSPSFLKRASARFRRENVQGRFIHLDLRNVNYQKEFHGVYSWHGSFGYFTDVENFEVLCGYANALRRTGRVLIDQPNRERLLRNFRPSGCCRNVTTKNRWNPNTERLETDWIIERNGKKTHNHMSMRLYTPDQMKRLFEKADLSIENIYGSHAGDPYNRSSKRLIVVGRK